MKRILLPFLSGFLLAVLLTPISSSAQVPTTLAYQGYLTDTDGTPLDGTANLAFRLYDAPTGGNALWAESQLDVPVSEGVFAANLGAVEPLDKVAFDRPLWLAVHVNGGNELSPRVALTAAPYALSTRGLRVIPAEDEDDAPSIIAGDASNTFNGNNEGGATISGGGDNTAGRGATVGGGEDNAALSCYDTVGGGENNRAEGLAGGNKASGVICGATIGGGSSNEANNEVATVGGGRNNTASGGSSTVGGGSGNTASGKYGTVPGGVGNTAAGAYSFAAGRNAEANHDGTFVWSDPGTADTPGNLSSTAENQFLIRATGGVGIGTNAPQGALHVTDGDGGMDLILGGTEDSLFGDDGRIASDPAFPSSDLLLFSNNSVGVVLDFNNDEEEDESAFLVTDESLNVAFQVDLTGAAATGNLTLEKDLGQGATLEDGGVYRDNVVYAWAHVNADGTVAASFGCTVLKTGTGLYRVTYDVSLNSGAAPVVTPLSANDPVMAVVSPGGTNLANVRVFGFVNGQFQAQDRPFFIQVTGRP